MRAGLKTEMADFRIKLMSASGHKRTYAVQKGTSGLPDSDRESGFPQNGHVRFTPKTRHVRCKSDVR